MTMNQDFQTIILGAGPAGLQMAYHLEKAGRSYVVLEKNDHAGSFFSEYPRHRTLLSINKRFTGRDDPEFNMRHDWNSLVCDDEEMRMTKYSRDYFPSADDLVRYLKDFAQHYSLNVRYGCSARQIRKDESDGSYVIETEGGDDLRCKCLLVATGLSKANVPDIPGMELAEGYESMSVDADEFENQNVLILGKGNSAFETADHLIGSAAIIHVLSPTPLRLAWESRFVGNLRAVNNNLLDTYHLKSQNAVIDGIIHGMTKTEEGKVRVKFSSIHAKDETEQLDYDRVLCCTGFRFDTSIFAENCRPELTPCGRLPLMTTGWESSTAPNMFFLGAPTQSLDYRKSQSAFIHGFRYNVGSLFQLLEQRLEQKPLPRETSAFTPNDMATHILTRMNRVSSLWQQVGYLADLVIVPREGEPDVEYIHDLPYKYLTEHAETIASGRDYYICMYRLGHCPGNPFDHPRTANPDEGDASTAIHPIFEFYSGGMLKGTHHVLEDFLGDWSGEEYRESAAKFFEHSLRGEEPPKEALKNTRHIVRDGNMRLVSSPAAH